MACLLLLTHAFLTGAAPHASFAWSMAQLHQTLDFNRPDLAVVRDAFETADPHAAAQALLDHFRERTRPAFYFSQDTITSIAEAARRDFPEEVDATMARADRTVEHAFPSTCAPTIVEWISLPQEIPWTNPPRGGKDLEDTLARSLFWVDLGLAYAYTGDAHYAQAFADQLESWLDHVPLPATTDANRGTVWWTTLNAGLRCESWPWAYYLFLNSPAITPELHARMLAVLAEHALLLHQYHASTGSNWASMEMRGLLNLGILFSEFKESAVWRDYARDTLLKCLKEQVRPDGVQIEQSPSYHNVCLMVFAQAMHLARLNDVRFPEALQNTLAKMATFTLWSLDPQGLLVALSDTDRDNSGRQTLATAALLGIEGPWRSQAKLEPQHYWLFGPEACTVLKDPVPAPPDTLRVFPDAGYVFMRSDWTPAARYAAFDCGPHGGPHGHLDLLNLEIHGYGAMLVADPGRYGYFQAGGKRPEIATPVHNTISLDDASYTPSETAPDQEYELVAAEQRDGWTHVYGRHRAYAHLAGAPTVERRVWFDGQSLWLVLDTVQSGQVHDIQTTWQFAGEGATPLGKAGVLMRYASGPAVAIAAASSPEGALAIESSRIHRVYATQEPADRTVLRLQAANAHTATLICALPPGTAAPSLRVNLRTENGAFPVTVEVAEEGKSFAVTATRDGWSISNNAETQASN
jgi:hypothetical protein